MMFNLILFVVDCLFFSMTNPNKVPSLVLIVGFSLVALSLNGVLRFIVIVAAIYGLPVGRHSQRIALFISIAMATALALQSVGELTLRDVIVLSLLSVVSYLYISYGRVQRQNQTQ
jgi:hypothetical protein